MRRAALALAVLGLGAAAAGVLAMAPTRQPLPELERPAASPVPAAETLPAAVAARPPSANGGRVRAVAPDVVALPAVEPHELERVEARVPLSTFAAPSRKRKNHGRIFRPLIQAAGRVSGSGLAIELPGIVATEADRICTDVAGAAWACGMRARTAFRAFVRGRALQCELPEDVTAARYEVACTLGRQDVAAWLVAQGWVEARADGPYAAAGEAARAEGKGIFGPAPVIEPLPDPEPFVSALPEPMAPPSATE